MILSATLSKPTSLVTKRFSQPLIKIKIFYVNSKDGGVYFLEEFTKTQVFHKRLSENELNAFLDKNIGTTFKNCVQKTQEKEITFLTNNKGKITRIEKPLQSIKNTVTTQKNKTYKAPLFNHTLQNVNQNKQKNYILKEGTAYPFLVLLGIMNDQGKVINSKYDKFRQINRFLEFIADVVNELKPQDQSKPFTIIDFGCGKSYLTFAAQYYFSQIKKINFFIEGLDLKKEVIDYCNQIVNKLSLQNINFTTGDIASYSKTETPDLIITLHACDTATDFALKYAVEKKAKAILSVPCCQKQINNQLQKNTNDDLFSPLLKYGLIKEKFSSLLTDALRGEWLEQQGYKVQMLEFIDIEHTPKNILIKAIKKQNKNNSNKPKIVENLHITPELWK